MCWSCSLQCELMIIASFSFSVGLDSEGKYLHWKYSLLQRHEMGYLCAIISVSSKPYQWRQKCQLKSFVLYFFATLHLMKLDEFLDITEHDTLCFVAHDTNVMWYNIIDIAHCKHSFSVALRLTLITCFTKSMQFAGNRKFFRAWGEIYFSVQNRFVFIYFVGLFLPMMRHFFF